MSYRDRVTDTTLGGLNMSTLEWTKIQKISLAQSVREAGFDITVYDNYSKQTQSELKKSAIKNVLKEISDKYMDLAGKDISAVKKGVYVICLSNPFTIRYESGSSEIIYIGQGNIISRLETHFHASLFNFMQSLSGTEFDIQISDPDTAAENNMLHKHIEFSLLDTFKDKFGGKERAYPLLNKNSGSDKSLDLPDGWKKPLSGQGKKPAWSLRPTKHWRFAGLEDK